MWFPDSLPAHNCMWQNIIGTVLDGLSLRREVPWGGCRVVLGGMGVTGLEFCLYKWASLVDIVNNMLCPVIVFSMEDGGNV